MNQRPIDTPYQKIIPLLLFCAVITSLLYSAGLLHLTDPVNKALLFTWRPYLVAINIVKTGVGNELSTITQARTLASKYRAATEQNMVLRAEVAQLSAIAEENSKLREQLGSPQLDRFKLTPAKVIAKERELTIVYDKNNTIAKDSIVVYKNNFVGKITKASDRAATLSLATDPQTEVPVSVITSKNQLIKGIAKGEFGTGIVVERLEQDAKIQNGDVVVLAKAQGLPEGVVVGEIRDVNKKESELFQKAKVISSIQFEKLDTVFIIQ